MSLQERVINHFTNSIQTQQEAVVNLSELIGFASQRLVMHCLTTKKLSPAATGDRQTTRSCWSPR
jgi:D-sedoheptulose 7-phosphate isomerase